MGCNDGGLQYDVVGKNTDAVLGDVEAVRLIKRSL